MIKLKYEFFSDSVDINIIFYILDIFFGIFNLFLLFNTSKTSLKKFIISPINKIIEGTNLAKK